MKERSANPISDFGMRIAEYNVGGHGDLGCPRVCAVAAQVAAEKILEIKR